MQPRIIKPILNDRDLPIEKCFQQCYSWSSMLDHYRYTTSMLLLDCFFSKPFLFRRQVHHLQLIPILDFCDMCHTVFYDRFHGLLHYLHHALLYKSQNLTHEPPSTQSHPTKTCVECKDIFKSLQTAGNHFSLVVNFGDSVKMDDAEADQLLDLLDHAVEKQEGEDMEEGVDVEEETATTVSPPAAVPTETSPPAKKKCLKDKSEVCEK